MIKIIFIITITILQTYAGLFGDTEEKKRIAKKRLELALTLKQNPKIQTLRKENTYIEKILRKHHIDYKTIIQTKIRDHKIKKITNPLLVTEEEEIKTLEQINQELKRLLEVNYIDYKAKKHTKKKINITITNK